MRITYYALRDVKVGHEVRVAGDLVPEAIHWPFLAGHVADGRLAPVLVATLPEEAQMMLMEWEEEQRNPGAPTLPLEASEPDPVKTTGDTTIKAAKAGKAAR